MKEEPTLRAYFRGLWRAEPTSITVEKNLELILVSNARIPIKYWRPNFDEIVKSRSLIIY